jgi:hypothetical protein
LSNREFFDLEQGGSFWWIADWPLSGGDPDQQRPFCALQRGKMT